MPGQVKTLPIPKVLTEDEMHDVTEEARELLEKLSKALDGMERTGAYESSNTWTVPLEFATRSHKCQDK